MNANTKNTVVFLKAHAADKSRLAKLRVHGTVGAACAGRLAAKFQTAAQNLAIRVGEHETLRLALIQNGCHPSYQNGHVARGLRGL